LSFFNPGSVAGYPAHYQEPDFDRHWFSSTTIISRYKLMESLIYSRNTIAWGEIYTVLDSISFVKNNISNPSDPIELVKEISGILYCENINDDRVNYFVSQLVDGYDNYYWTSEWLQYINNNDTLTVKSRLDKLLIAMVNAAEFQVM